MSSLKQFKLEAKALAHQQVLVTELDTLMKSIERCEKTILKLKAELEAVNEKHQNRKTTQDDIDYLTDLLDCAKKKQGWEKQVASLQKRTPDVLQHISTLMNDPQHPPADEIRAAILRALQGIQLAMERIEKIKVE